jgi:transcriptional regulator with XRE-family HTH domain
MSLLELVTQAKWNKKIAVLQALNGWTQEETATKCGTTQKVYWLWLQAACYPRSNSRRAIAAAFGVPEKEIFGE